MRMAILLHPKKARTVIRMVRMIAVWGSNGSGKKTLALALAAQLAGQQKNSVIISTDSSVPALPVFLPGKQIDREGSLGELLSRPVNSVNALKGYIHIHPQSDHIGVMGIASGETPLTYRSFKREIMMSLLRALNDSPFDFVIFCCQANPVLDALTQLALSTSEYPIRMITPDVRGIEFERAQTGWLRGIPEMRVDKHIRIFGPVMRVSPLDKVRGIIGAGDYMLPFSEEVYSKSLAGQLVSGCRDRFGVQYDRQVSRLAGRIVGS